MERTPSSILPFMAMVTISQNDREENDVTGNEFFTEEEAKKRIEELKHRGYISDAEYLESPRPNTNTYELWPDADEYLDDLITEEG